MLVSLLGEDKLPLGMDVCVEMSEWEGRQAKEEIKEEIRVEGSEEREDVRKERRQ